METKPTPDTAHLIQEHLAATKTENQNPDYQRVLAEYADNPFYDMTVRPDEQKAKPELKTDEPA